MISAPGPNQLLVRGLMFVTVILACTANHDLNDTIGGGSGLITVADDEDGKLIQPSHSYSAIDIAIYIAPNMRHNRQHKLALELLRILHTQNNSYY